MIDKEELKETLLEHFQIEENDGYSMNQGCYIGNNNTVLNLETIFYIIDNM